MTPDQEIGLTYKSMDTSLSAWYYLLSFNLPPAIPTLEKCQNMDYNLILYKGHCTHSY